MKTFEDRPRDAVYFAVSDLIRHCIERDSGPKYRLHHFQRLHADLWAAVDRFRDVSKADGEPLKPGDILDALERAGPKSGRYANGGVAGWTPVPTGGEGPEVFIPRASLGDFPDAPKGRPMPTGAPVRVEWSEAPPPEIIGSHDVSVIDLRTGDVVAVCDSAGRWHTYKPAPAGDRKPQ